MTLTTVAMNEHSTGNLAWALSRLAQERDAHVWSVLLEQVGSDIQQLAHRLIGDYALAEDAVQETLLSIRDHAGRFSVRTENDNEDARRWILGVASNVSLQILRRQVRQVRRDQHAGHEQNSEKPPVPEPSSVVERTEEYALIRSELAALPSLYGQALTLHFFAGQDYQAVASGLNTSVNTVRSRVHRGLKYLRERLERRGVTLSVAALSGLLTNLGAAPVAVSTAVSTTAMGLITSSAVPTATITVATGGLVMSSVLTIVLVTAMGLMTYAMGWFSPEPPPTAPVTAVNDQNNQSVASDTPPLPLVGEKGLSVNFNNTPFREALQVVEQKSGQQIAVDAPLIADADPVTLSLTNVQFDEVLLRLLRPRGLEAIRENQQQVTIVSADSKLGMAKAFGRSLQTAIKLAKKVEGAVTVGDEAHISDWTEEDDNALARGIIDACASYRYFSDTMTDVLFDHSNVNNYWDQIFLRLDPLLKSSDVAVRAGATMLIYVNATNFLITTETPTSTRERMSQGLNDPHAEVRLGYALIALKISLRAPSIFDADLKTEVDRKREALEAEQNAAFRVLFEVELRKQGLTIEEWEKMPEDRRRELLSVAKKVIKKSDAYQKLKEQAKESSKAVEDNITDLYNARFKAHILRLANDSEPLVRMMGAASLWRKMLKSKAMSDDVLGDLIKLFESDKSMLVRQIAIPYVLMEEIDFFNNYRIYGDGFWGIVKNSGSPRVEKLGSGEQLQAILRESNPIGRALVPVTIQFGRAWGASVTQAAVNNGDYKVKTFENDQWMAFVYKMLAPAMQRKQPDWDAIDSAISSDKRSHQFIGILSGLIGLMDLQKNTDQPQMPPVKIIEKLSGSSWLWPRIAGVLADAYIPVLNEKHQLSFAPGDIQAAQERINVALLSDVEPLRLTALLSKLHGNNAMKQALFRTKAFLSIMRSRAISDRYALYKTNASLGISDLLQMIDGLVSSKQLTPLATQQLQDVIETLLPMANTCEDESDKEALIVLTPPSAAALGRYFSDAIKAGDISKMEAGLRLYSKKSKKNRTLRDYWLQNNADLVKSIDEIPSALTKVFNDDAVGFEYKKRVLHILAHYPDLVPDSFIAGVIAVLHQPTEFRTKNGWHINFMQRELYDVFPALVLRFGPGNIDRIMLDKTIDVKVRTEIAREISSEFKWGNKQALKALYVKTCIFSEFGKDYKSLPADLVMDIVELGLDVSRDRRFDAVEDLFTALIGDAEFLAKPGVIKKMGYAIYSNWHGRPELCNHPERILKGLDHVQSVWPKSGSSDYDKRVKGKVDQVCANFRKHISEKPQRPVNPPPAADGGGF